MNNNMTKVQEFAERLRKSIGKWAKVSVATMAMGTIGPQGVQAISHANATAPAAHHGRYAHVHRASHHIAKIANPKAHELTADELNKAELTKLYAQSAPTNNAEEIANQKSIENEKSAIENLSVTHDSRGREIVKNHINENNHERIDFEKYVPKKFQKDFKNIEVFRSNVNDNVAIITSKKGSQHNEVAIVEGTKDDIKISFMGKQKDTQAFRDFRNGALEFAAGEALINKRPLTINCHNLNGVVFADAEKKTGIKNSYLPFADVGDNVKNMGENGVQVISAEEYKAIQPRLNAGLETHDVKTPGYYLDQGASKQDEGVAEDWNKHMKENHQVPVEISTPDSTQQPEFKY